MENGSKCIAFANHKGGTGKTTSCISIAGFLAKKGFHVLIIDFDPQANATSGLGIDRMTLHHTVYDAILYQVEDYTGVPLSRVIVETGVENLHIAPSELDLSVARVIMQSSKGRTGILKRAIEEIKSSYDYILIDLPPTSDLLTINGLCAADHVVVPLDASIYSLDALEDMKSSFRDIRCMTGHTIDAITIILVRYVGPDLYFRLLGKKNASQEVKSRLKDIFPSFFVIPESHNFYQAQKMGIPISHYLSKSRAGRVYEKVAQEIIDGDK